MPAVMQLVVTLRRDVLDTAEAQTLIAIVKDKLSDHPEITITSHAAVHFETDPPPP